VKQSDGFIDVESEQGRGATFTVYLPVVGASAEPEADAAHGAGLAGRETVLVVEDEHGVRQMIRIMLDKYGYTVLEASNGTEAIEVSTRHESQIDLLLTDLVMPQIGGRELAELLRPQRPDMKVLFMSGYTDDIFIRQGISDATASLLLKPFTAETLAERLRELLDRGTDD
jgi:CheY-like chemotaxis protein